MKIFGCGYVQEFELNGKNVIETITDDSGNKETYERDFSYMTEMIGLALDEKLKIEY